VIFASRHEHVTRQYGVNHVLALLRDWTDSDARTVETASLMDMLTAVAGYWDRWLSDGAVGPVPAPYMELTAAWGPTFFRPAIATLHNDLPDFPEEAWLDDMLEHAGRVLYRLIRLRDDVPVLDIKRPAAYAKWNGATP